MKVIRWVNLLLIITFLAACSSNAEGTKEPFNPFAKATDTPLPTAAWTVEHAPDEKAAITKYLEALQKDDFEAMYGMLAQQSRDSITLEDYSKRWNDSLNQMSAKEIEFTVGSGKVGPYDAEVGY